MHGIVTRVRHQDRINSHLANSDQHQIFSLLTSGLLRDKVKELSPEGYRERFYSPAETLSMFLLQAMSSDRSCQNIVNQVAAQRLVASLPSASTNTGAYCLARQRLPVEMIRGITQYLGKQLDAQVPALWRWKGRKVRVVDGTTLSMPDTPDNQASFPQSASQKPGLGFPVCRLLGITCLASGVLLNAAIGPSKGKGSGEQTLLRSMESTFETHDIVMGDAIFPTYFFIAAMQIKGVDILMEQQGARKRTTDFRQGKKLGKYDHLIVINKPKIRPDWVSESEYAKAPESLTLREFKSGEKIIITTLYCPKSASKEELKALYQSRWQVELDIRHIKATMGMGVLSCKTPGMICKEIWAYLLAYNLIRLLMAQSALLADLMPRNLGFKHCLQLWLFTLERVHMMDEQQLNLLFELMTQKQVGKRPGRIEPRVVKRRPKPFSLMTEPRSEAREKVKKYGHPKKKKA